MRNVWCESKEVNILNSDITHHWQDGIMRAPPSHLGSNDDDDNSTTNNDDKDADHG